MLYLHKIHIWWETSPANIEHAKVVAVWNTNLYQKHGKVEIQVVVVVEVSVVVFLQLSKMASVDTFTPLD